MRRTPGPAPVASSANQDCVQRFDELRYFLRRGVVHKGKADHAARRVYAHGVQQPHRVKVAGPGHDSPLSQRKMNLRGCDLVRHKGDGGRALAGDTRPEEPDVLARFQIVEEPVQERLLRTMQ